MVSFKQFEPKPLLLLNAWLPLKILNGLVVCIIIFRSKSFDERIKLLTNGLQLSVVTGRFNVLNTCFKIEKFHAFHL